MKKRILHGTLFLLVLLIFISTNIIPVQAKPTIKKHTSQICVGQSFKLQVVGTKKKVQWKSSNKKIASISSNGLIKAKKKGTVTIVAKIDKKSLTCKIKVVNHKYKNATCTTAKKCMRCNKTSGNALGHQYQDATCTTPRTCIRCNTTSGNALGHQYQNATCTNPKTCARCNTTSGNALGHQYQDATCTTPRTCARCNTTSGNALGHLYQDATCTTPRTCARCNTTSGNALGHQYQNATCTNPKTCIRCNTTSGNPLGHIFSEATCTSPETCLRCNVTQGSALGHNFTAATCTSPETCIRCNATQGYSLGHQYDMENGEIIGTKGNLQGIKTTCTRCSESILQSPSQLPLKIRLMYHNTANYSGENASVLQSLYTIMDEIITPEMSDEEKIKTIHDYLIFNANYYSGDINTTPGWSAAIKGVIQNRSGVCNSYALAFYAMATSEGIPCKFISGTATNSLGSSGGHAWNQVFVNGDWYYIDCTWDDPIGGGFERYDYYLSKELWSSHSQESSEDLADKNEFLWINYYLCGQGWD